MRTWSAPRFFILAAHGLFALCSVVALFHGTSDLIGALMGLMVLAGGGLLAAILPPDEMFGGWRKFGWFALGFFLDFVLVYAVLIPAVYLLAGEATDLLYPLAFFWFYVGPPLTLAGWLGAWVVGGLTSDRAAETF